MKALGKRDWAVAGGRIPFLCSGPEREFISHDKISVLNTSEEDARIELVIYYEDVQPVATYTLMVKAKRLRKIRFNDLIDPEAIRMERNYGCYLKSDIPVVVQFSRLNSGAAANAELAATAYPANS